MARTNTLTDGLRSETSNLHTHDIREVDIARQVGSTRRGETAVVSRTESELAKGQNDPLGAIRDDALAVYDEIQREAWTRLEKCSPDSGVANGLLATILEARRRQDRLIGLEDVQVNHTNVYLAQIATLLHAPVDEAMILDAEDGDDDNN